VVVVLPVVVVVVRVVGCRVVVVRPPVVVVVVLVVSSTPSLRHAVPANINERPNPHSCALTERVAENSEVSLNRNMTARLACLAVKFMGFVGLSKWLPKLDAQKDPCRNPPTFWTPIWISVPGATSRLSNPEILRHSKPPLPFTQRSKSRKAKVKDPTVTGVLEPD